ncbi:MAG: hypothetical protein MI747_21440, partial [Desulfobacterales bacterium]|nr:hypothetical protein [Desulfobacterales bacterium]
MRSLFSPWSLGPIELKNRLVRSATVEGLSTEDGAPTQRLIDITTELARGGVGLIIAGTAYISREGQADKNATGLDHDGLIPPLGRLCRSVESAGGILAAQLLHCGSTMSAEFLKRREVIYGPSDGMDLDGVESGGLGPAGGVFIVGNDLQNMGLFQGGDRNAGYGVCSGGGAVDAAFTVQDCRVHGGPAPEELGGQDAPGGLHRAAEAAQGGDEPVVVQAGGALIGLAF